MTTNVSRKIYAPIPVETERVGKTVLDAAFKVHTVLGPGLLESVYKISMKHVLTTNGLLAETEVKLPIVFEDVTLESGLKIWRVLPYCAIN